MNMPSNITAETQNPQTIISVHGPRACQASCATSLQWIQIATYICIVYY